MGNPVTHFQIVTPAPEQVAAFYAGLFGWSVDDANPLRYRRLLTGEKRGIEGGIWPAPPDAPSFVQLHVEVADVPASVARAQELGAAVLVPVQTLPQGERMAVLRDPAGLSFVLHSPASAR